MKQSRTEATLDTARATAARQPGPRRKAPRRTPPKSTPAPPPTPTPAQRTAAMAEAIATLRIQRGIDQAVTEQDLRRAGFTAAEITALGDDAVARAHGIIAEAGCGRAA